jgi:hypothetical protein
MKHAHKKTGIVFEVGDYVDVHDDKVYDMTIISYWNRPDDEDPPVLIVGYYFGDYDAEVTDYYIDKWLANNEKEVETLQTALGYLDAYLTINGDVMETRDIGILKECIDSCKEIIDEREQQLCNTRESAFKMSRAEYERFIGTLASAGDITKETADTLLELSINFPE